MALPNADHPGPHGDSFQEHPNVLQERVDSVSATTRHRHRKKRKFVLCFDGTGNKFSGTDADSNILKIYRMLDRNEDDQFHYYQPGIGTYVAKSSKSMSHSSTIDKVKSWYAKAKDSAVGTSFDAHVMGGYKFLMRYYSPGDDIFLFGFSRGAYTARFLAEMLDHVGLLSAGNEEMCHFAWKTFQKWQCRQERNAEEKQQKKHLLEFMCAFRETFSRPVRAVRFLGLFDTVNSVPRFENAWMQRSKFPYTARSSAKVIRHAVSIDERRAKFRQDLISQDKPNKTNHYKRHHNHGHFLRAFNGPSDQPDQGDQIRGRKTNGAVDRRDTLVVPERYRNRSETSGVRSLSPAYSSRDFTGLNSAATSVSNLSLDAIRTFDDVDSEEAEQDIQEVWFAGCHADIGGGWPLHKDEETPLSHVPLVWMVREAQKAGLQFDEIKLRALNCWYETSQNPDYTAPIESRRPTICPVPTIEIGPASPAAVGEEHTPTLTRSPVNEPNGSNSNGDANGALDHGTPHHHLHHHHHHHHHPNKLHHHLHTAATKGKIHDVLQFKQGATSLSVVCWNIMEYLPFRRMDLKEDGSWKSITWPLPKGEVRDIPDNAVIHSSVIERMLADPTYRPGNLIVGGGGRGVRRAPEEMGIGKWVVTCEDGHPVGECYIRKEKPEKRKNEKAAKPVSMAPNGPQGVFLTGG